MPEVLLGHERIRKEGVDKGIILGRKEGLALGQKKGLALGQKKGLTLGRESLTLDMLKSGKMTDSMICEVAGISKTELDKLKRKLKN